MSKKRVENYVYKLNEVLGQGSFGTVYKGVDQKTKEDVAVKVLNKKKINLDEYMRQALRLQIRILNRIKSDYIVRFKDVIETSNNYYIVQQFCNQGDLGKFLKEKKFIPQQQAIDKMAMILTGFYELIRQGIVHRDMKPQNILIKNGKLKIADFGLARPTHDARLLESSVGTPLYQPPQLLALDKYTYKCDVWALGLIFYQMMYGKLPWKSGGNLKTLLENIRGKKLQFPAEPHVTKQTKKFIEECLQVNEEDRADWEAIYSSIVFKDKLPKYQNLTEVYNYTITKLRKSIHESNLNLEMFFKAQKLDTNSSLNKKQFAHMMFKLSKELSDHEIEYMFTKFDEDRNGQIEFQEFRKCLQNADVRRTSMNRRDIKKILSITLQDEVDKASLELEQKFSQIADRLRIIMESKQIYDLYQLFVNCDKDRQGYLKPEKMMELLNTIDEKLTEDDCKVVFKKFDQNGDGKISFQQFYKNMCLLTGSPIMSESKKVK